MVGLGILLMLLGAGSLLLPMIGFQFRLMELLDAYQPWAGIIVAVVGAALAFAGMTRRRETTVEVTRAPQDPPPAP
jgi:hypothetical protein